MVLHSSKLISLCLQLWGVFCICLIMCVRVRGDAMVAQTCNTQTSQACQAMIGYVPSVNYDLSEIALLFSLNYSSLLGPNDIDPSLPNLSKLVLPASSPYSIPQTCGCVSGKRVVTSTNYTVRPTNILSVISDSFYSKLVTYQEIAAANGVADPNKIFPGQTFTIPIPCACFNQSNATQPAIFLSYQIQSGDSLSGIAEAHNTSAANLQNLNSLQNNSISEGSVLFVPLSVCKANFSSGALDKDLTVVEGKYELTANACVLCNCNNGTLHCSTAPSSLGSSCSNTTCASSNITLGSSTTSQGNGECTVQSCVYKGYNQTGIMPMLETEQVSSCPVALPPESFYKPPTGLVASPLTPPGETPSTSSSTPPPSSTPAAIAPTPTTTNSNSANAFLIGVDFSSWWWCLLGAIPFL